VEEIQRAVQSVEFMTARGAGLTYESLEHASSRILNKISGISHISHDISSKTPATIQWE
jgi:GMP synthase (glutamine-hydrolysing)